MKSSYHKIIFILLAIFFTGCESESSSKNKEVQHTYTYDSLLKGTKIIDVLVIVDKNDPNNFNGKNEIEIDHGISVSNTIFDKSKVHAQLNIKKIHARSFKAKNSIDALHEVYQDDKIGALRNEVAADLVVIYRKYSDDGYCGLAYTNNKLDKDIAYAHISLGCPSMTTAHEIGHTMGLAHSAHKSNAKKLFPFSQGYGVKNEFVTTMAYKSNYQTSTRLFTYSSPDLDCKGHPCGVEEGLDNPSNAVKSLNYAVDYVSKFR